MLQWLWLKLPTDSRLGGAAGTRSADLRGSGGTEGAATAGCVSAVWSEAGAPELVGRLCAGHDALGRECCAIVPGDVAAACGTFYRLAWTTMKRIDFRHLEQALGPVELDGLTVIGMDEFAIHTSLRDRDRGTAAETSTMGRPGPRPRGRVTVL